MNVCSKTRSLSAKRMPFWSDVLEGGSSMWSNPQAGVLSPLQMVARVFPIQYHLLAALALKMLVAFQGTWLLARVVGRSRAASLRERLVAVRRLEER